MLWLGAEGGVFTVVDDDTWQRAVKYKWNLCPQGYATSVIDGSWTLLHKLVLPADLVDHIDGDRLNNMRSNLRVATFSENSQNRAKKPGCSSQYIGVYKHRNLWRARVKKDHKTHQAGGHSCEVAAARAYDELAQKLYTNPRLNFPKLQSC